MLIGLKSNIVYSIVFLKGIAKEISKTRGRSPCEGVNGISNSRFVKSVVKVGKSDINEIYTNEYENEAQLTN